MWHAAANKHVKTGQTCLWLGAHKALTYQPSLCRRQQHTLTTKAGAVLTREGGAVMFWGSTILEAGVVRVVVSLLLKSSTSSGVAAESKFRLALSYRNLQS